MPKNIKALPFFPPFHMAESGMLKDTQDLTSSTLNAWDGRHWCHRNCEKIHADSDFLGVAQSICKAKCNSMYDAPEHSSQGPTDIDVSDTLRGIGDNFHALADSVSIL